MAGLPTVTSKAGDKYAVNSPQGKMIWNAAKNRAAESAAGSNSFKPDSPALTQIASTVEGISQGVGVLVLGQAAMLTIAQSDARDDALKSADVTQVPKV